MIHKSGLQKESDLKNKWLRLVAGEVSIKRTDLMRILGITLRQYKNYAGVIQEENEDSIEYNRFSKRWVWIKKEETEQSEKNEVKSIEN